MQPRAGLKLILVVLITILAACGGSSNPARSCVQDSDCNLGEVCNNDVCTAGCRSARDCPIEKPECLDGTCRKTCESDADCGGGRCDLDAKVCIDCFDSADCALGKLCIDQTCTEGCERDRDCPMELPKCDPDKGDNGTCVQCLTNSHCGANQKCSAENECRDSCTSNAQCTFGVCDVPNEICVDCLDKMHCPLGEICDAKQCVIGCEEDRDCPTLTPSCDPNAGPNGTCYQCQSNADCGANGMCVDNECQGDSSAMINIPAGTFAMGFGTERHMVTLSAYSIDMNEVTNARYKLCVDAGACLAPSTTTEYADATKAQFPVAYVTWQKAATYCAWAGKRLPTEAEWERAARGTDERTYPWGATTPNCTLTNGSVGGAGSDICVDALTAVGTHPTGMSAAGLHDMAGNAREWVSDWYAAYPAGNATDPQGPGSGTDKIARGGSFVSIASELTTYVRPIRAPSSADSFIGFRCAKGGISPAFTVTPGSGTVSTNFVVDASSSTDASYATSQLQVRWDWTNDGTYDTSFTTTKTATRTYATAGLHTIRLEVKNPANATRSITRTVSVTGAGGGGQGAPCTASSQCNTNYVCLTSNTCAESCLAATVCTNPLLTCGPAFEIGGGGTFTLACQ
jgi:formylglycine-generating enzyme required for sulfatase activity